MPFNAAGLLTLAFFAAFIATQGGCASRKESSKKDLTVFAVKYSASEIGGDNVYAWIDPGKTMARLDIDSYLYVKIDNQVMTYSWDKLDWHSTGYKFEKPGFYSNLTSSEKASHFVFSLGFHERRCVIDAKKMTFSYIEHFLTPKWLLSSWKARVLDEKSFEKLGLTVPHHLILNSPISNRSVLM
jgi:hypothetical protein